MEATGGQKNRARKSLDENQRKLGILTTEAPKDIVTAASRKVTPLEPTGLPAPHLPPLAFPVGQPPQREQIGAFEETDAVVQRQANTSFCFLRYLSEAGAGEA